MISMSSAAGDAKAERNAQRSDVEETGRIGLSAFHFGTAVNKNAIDVAFWFSVENKGLCSSRALLAPWED